LTPSEFRSTAQWQRARQRKLATGPAHCTICGRALSTRLGPRHSSAPSVDHVVPLAELNLATEAGRRQACDQSLLRVVCIGCNSRRGSAYAARRRGLPRIFSLNDTVRRQAERRNNRW
jgi:5-methylcytosine-specific restriction endonuclease McrA